MNINQSETRNNFPLSRRKILKKSLVAGIVWTLLFMVPGLMLFIASSGAITSAAAIPTLIFLAGLVLIYLYQIWYFSVYYYQLEADYIVIKKHPITPKEITIPYERFQDVYMDQDILDRLLGIYDVHLSSATISSGMEAHIDGLEKQAADGLKSALLKILTEKIGAKNQPVNTTQAGM